MLAAPLALLLLQAGGVLAWPTLNSSQAAAHLLLGAFLAWSLAGLPDFYTRLHGPSKASALGVGGMLVAAMLYFAARGNAQPA